MSSRAKGVQSLQRQDGIHALVCTEKLPEGFNFSRFGIRSRGNNTRRSWRNSLCTSTLDQADLADFLHTPNHQRPQPNHWVTPSFLMCSFRCLSTYIPSMLWLRMCYSRIIHPKPEHFCLPFFWGGGLFKVNSP